MAEIRADGVQLRTRPVIATTSRTASRSLRRTSMLPVGVTVPCARKNTIDSTLLVSRSGEASGSQVDFRTLAP